MFFLFAAKSSRKAIPTGVLDFFYRFTTRIYHPENGSFVRILSNINQTGGRRFYMENILNEGFLQLENFGK